MGEIQSHLTRRPIVYDAIWYNGTKKADLRTSVPYFVQLYMNPYLYPERWAHREKWNVLWADLHASTNGPGDLGSGLFDYDKYGGWNEGPAHSSFSY